MALVWALFLQTARSFKSCSVTNTTLSASTRGQFPSPYTRRQSAHILDSGVYRTTPQVKVFPIEAEGAAWRLREAADPMPIVSPDGVPRLYARAQVYGDIANLTTREDAFVLLYARSALSNRGCAFCKRGRNSDELGPAVIDGSSCGGREV